MAEKTHYWRQALDCARRATETQDLEERDLLFKMSTAWRHLAAVEADVTKQAEMEWAVHTLH